MYLERKSYVKNWRHMQPEELHKITITKDGQVVKTIKPERISYVLEDVAYWRKANQIHNWFTKDQDDDTQAHVNSYQLKDLLDTCKRVKKSLEAGGMHTIKAKNRYNNSEQEITVYKDTELAEAELPSHEGFFFGNYDYDEWYMENIDYTIKTIRKLLKEESEGAEANYLYTASY